ncbi:MAG: S8 family peptidase [Stackebrandtia sp.]
MRRGSIHLNTRRRRLAAGAGMLAVALGASMLAAQQSWSDPADDLAVPVSAAGADAETVTLITGDRVVLNGGSARNAPEFVPAEGRENIPVSLREDDGRTLAVPADAAPLIAAGLVDERLFDVAGLLESGYGDSDRDDVPLIMETPDTHVAGLDVTQSLPGLGVLAATAPKSAADDFWKTVTAGDDASALSGGVDRIWLDGMRQPLLDESVPQIGAPDAWDAGYDGEGVKVAVVDTGVDADHPDLKGKVADSKNFTEEDPGDVIGHGTHVAATVAGEGEYTGVAPGARILDGKVCEAGGCPESAILAGMDWAAESGAAVVNVSLGGPAGPEVDPIEQAVEDLTAEHGMLFVIAAGNDGDFGDETVSSPGTAPSALTVGAVDKSDALASFSSRGPSIRGAALKPDVTAPGVEITAACVEGSQIGCDDGSGHVAVSGTSMATPHAAGSAAILAQQHPDATPAEIKSTLMGSAATQPDDGAFAQGAGRVDVGAAVEQTVHAEPASVSAGRAEWPHDDDEPVKETVTYRNSSDKDIVFNMSLTTLGPDGEAAPDGMFKVSADQVEVPAGGEATVDVTVDTTIDSPDGYYSAWVAADADGASVVTPVAVDKEVESYDVTVEAIDRDGSAAEYASLVLLRLDEPGIEFIDVEGGETTLRVPAGEYHVDADVIREDGDFEYSKLVQPKVSISEETTLTYDARDAEAVSAGPANDEVGMTGGMIFYDRPSDNGGLVSGVFLENYNGVYVGGVGDPVADDEMEVMFSSHWAPAQSDDLAYHLAFLETGQMPTGFERTVADDELARVEADYRSQAEGKQASKMWMASTGAFGLGHGAVTGIPGQRVEFHTVDDGIEWSAELEQVTDDFDSETLQGGVVDHEAGETYTETWNAAAFGPGLPASGSENSWVYREDDLVAVNLPLYSDAAADHYGFSVVDEASTVLYADGDAVGETEEAGYGEFEVSPDDAEYRLETEAIRSGVSDFSTMVSGAWTFQSGHVDGAEALPLSAARFAPAGLDENNYAEAGGTTTAPITVDSQIDDAGVDSLEVSASFDDGETWQELEVEDDDGKLSVDVEHPDAAGFVSLKYTLVDDDGNTAEVTILRAYGLK